MSNIPLPDEGGMATICGPNPESDMNIHLKTDDPEAVWSHQFLEELKVELRRKPAELGEVQPIRRRIERPGALSADESTVGLVIKGIQAAAAAIALVYTVVRNYIKDAEERENRLATPPSAGPVAGRVWMLRIGGQKEFDVIREADLPARVRAMIEAVPSADVQIVIQRLAP